MTPLDPAVAKVEIAAVGKGGFCLPRFVPCDYCAGPVVWKFGKLDGACVGLRVMTFGRALQPLQPVYLYIEGTDGDPFRAELEALP